MIFDFDEEACIQRHGLASNGPAQAFVDNQVITYCDPIVPFRDGYLKGSARTHTSIGSGLVIFKTPYARKQYYVPMSHSSGRSDKWFEHMKAAHKEDIKNGLKQFL